MSVSEEANAKAFEIMESTIITLIEDMDGIKSDNNVFNLPHVIRLWKDRLKRRLKTVDELTSPPKPTHRPYKYPSELPGCQRLKPPHCDSIFPGWFHGTMVNDKGEINVILVDFGIVSDDDLKDVKQYTPDEFLENFVYAKDGSPCGVPIED